MLRAVLVGCGAMSNGWLTALRDTPALAQAVQIVGLVDLDITAAQTQAARYGLSGAQTGCDLAAMLAALNPDIVFDLVVPPARRHVVELALAAGCHVLSEKPMANSIADAQSLLAAAQAAGRVHAIVQNRRHLAGIRRTRALIDSGALGQITALHADFFIGPHFGGFRDAMPHVLLLDMAIHTFDAARYLLPSEPVDVYCQETNPKGSWYAQGASANALFTCADGTLFTYRGSWCAEGADTSWEAAWRIIGTKGSALWDGNLGLTAAVVTDAPAQGLLRPTTAVSIGPQPDLAAEGHAGVMLDFITALQQGTPPLSVNTDNIKSLAMVFAAIHSAETGQRVSVLRQKDKA